MVAPLLIGFCVLCGTYVAKKAHDVFHKKEKNKKRKIELKGKTIDQARLDNEKAREEETKTRKELEETEGKIKKLEDELEKTKGKLNNPNLTDEERGLIKRTVTTLEDELSNLKNNKKSFYDKLKGLTERVKKNNSTISGTASNLDEKH